MKSIIIAFPLLLGGCAGAMQTIIEPAAQLEDSSRVAAETVLCRSISIGAWVRAYGNSPDKAKAWQTLCQDTINSMPAK